MISEFGHKESSESKTAAFRMNDFQTKQAAVFTAAVYLKDLQVSSGAAWGSYGEPVRT